MFSDKGPRKGPMFFSLTGDGVCTKNLPENGSSVLLTDGDGPVARIRPEEFSF